MRWPKSAGVSGRTSTVWSARSRQRATAAAAPVRCGFSCCNISGTPRARPDTRRPITAHWSACRSATTRNTLPKLPESCASIVYGIAADAIRRASDVRLWRKSVTRFELPIHSCPLRRPPYDSHPCPATSRPQWTSSSFTPPTCTSMTKPPPPSMATAPTTSPPCRPPPALPAPTSSCSPPHNLATPLRPSWLFSDDAIAATAADYLALGHWDRPERVGDGEPASRKRALHRLGNDTREV